VAIDAAREVTDDQLTAIAHGHIARLAAAAGLTVAALDQISAAREHARPTPAITSWLATIEADIHADRGDQIAARDALDRAQIALDQPGRSAPASFHHHDTAQVTAATGRILLRNGNYSHAREVLTAVVGDPRPTGRRQRLQVLIDIAIAELHNGNLADACSHATQAAELLQQTAYAVGAARLRAFRTAAQQPLTSSALRALDEHLIRVAA
jgi:hypothetical protein